MDEISSMVKDFEKIFVNVKKEVKKASKEMEELIRKNELEKSIQNNSNEKK